MKLLYSAPSVRWMIALITASSARCSAQDCGPRPSVWRNSTCRNSWQITAFTWASVWQCRSRNSGFSSSRGSPPQVTAAVVTSVVNSVDTILQQRAAGEGVVVDQLGDQRVDPEGRDLHA
jgi:hypothetical protein